MRSAAIGGLAALSLLAAPVRGEPHARTPHDNDVVARVNGTAIYRKDVRDVVEGILAVRDTPPDPNSIGQLASDALDSLIGLELLYQEAQARGVTVSDAAIDDEIARNKSHFPDAHSFETTLQAKGMTAADLRRDTRKTMVVDRFLEAHLWKDLRVTPEQIKGFYEQNKEQFKHPPEIRVSHILIRVSETASARERTDARRRAEELLERLKKGADFADMARTESQDPGSNAQGGDLGYVAKGDMDPAFEKEAFALAPGQLSGVIATPYGFHIIKVTGRRDAGYETLDEVQDRIRAVLLKEARQNAQAEMVAQLRQKARIELGEK